MYFVPFFLKTVYPHYSLVFNISRKDKKEKVKKDRYYHPHFIDGKN